MKQNFARTEKNNQFSLDAHPKDGTISEVMDQVRKHMETYGQFPSEVVLDAQELIDFCYFSEQYVNKPTVLGIPLVLRQKYVSEEDKFKPVE